MTAVERFVAAYQAQPPGEEHRLAVIYKGFASPEDAAPHEAIIGPHAARAHRLREADAGPSRLRARRRRCSTPSTCASSTPRACRWSEGWLAALAAAVRAPGVGAVGATGSYEATRSRLPLRRRRWPAFPNPHLRTNAFMISREVMRDLRWPDVATKAQAWELESGWRGMTRQLWSRGLRPSSSAATAAPTPPQRWAESATFRSGDQANLLVADNRTRQWEAADPAERERLSRLAWGDDPAATADGRSGPGALRLEPRTQARRGA